jgi:hypothetical protein
MASPAMSTGEPRLAPPSMENREQFIRVIVADSQAIFRAGLRKIFAVEDDIRVVGQAETLKLLWRNARQMPYKTFSSRLRACGWSP